MSQNNTKEQNLSKTSIEKAMDIVIPVKPALFSEEKRIAVFIPNQADIIDLIKKVPQSRWSPTYKCWHFLKTQANWDIFLAHFKDFTLNIQKDMPPLSIPASEMREKPKLQLKSDYLNHFVLPSEMGIQNVIKGKKEENQAAFIHKTPFLIEKVTYDGQNYMGIPIPSTDQTSRDMVKKMDGRIWHPQEYIWLLPYNHATYDKLKMAFEGKLQAPTSKEFRVIKPPVYPPQLTLKPKIQNVENTSLFDKLNGKQQLAVTKLEDLLIEERKAYHTMKGYRNIFIHFLTFYKEMIPSQITNEQIRYYILTRIKDENISKSTQNQMISTFKAFYGRLLEQHHKVNDLYRPNKEQHLPKTLEPAEIAKLFAQVGNVKHKCMLMLMYGSGLRVGEVVRLKWQDLDFVRKVMGHASIKTTQIYLHVLKTDLTKTRSPLDDLNI